MPSENTSRSEDAQPSPAGATREGGLKRRRYLAAAALLGGGVTVGAVFAPVGLAGAQTDDEDADTTEDQDSEDTDTTVDQDADDQDSDERDGDRRRGHRHGRGAGLEAMSELFGLSEDELRAEFEAGNSLADIAAAQGMTNDELIAGLLAAAEERLDEAVTEGKLDEAEAAERLAEAEERIPELIERTPGEGGFGRGHGHRHGRGLGFGEALEELGISTDELQAGREAGMTLAEIAAEQGVAEADLVDALVANAIEKVDQAVEAGRLDADRAAEVKENADERIAELIDTEPGERNGHSHPHRHGGRTGGSDADADADADSDADAGETEETGLTT